MVKELLLSQIGAGDGKLVLEPGAMSEPPPRQASRPAAFDVRYLELLRLSSLEVYGPLGGMNFETRELLLHFLGRRPAGGNPRLRQQRRPKDGIWSYGNSTILKLWDHESWPEELKRKKHPLSDHPRSREIRTEKVHSDGRCRLYDRIRKRPAYRRGKCEDPSSRNGYFS
jgi:hypothetical protein